MDVNNEFSSFANFMIQNGPFNINLHYHPFWYRCSVCHLGLDMVAKMETLDEDKRYLIKKLGLPDLDMGKKANVRGGAPTTDVAQELFRNLTQTQVVKLREIYKPDFVLFGYDIEPYYSLARKG